MKALVTGGAGFIGSHVTEVLLANKWQVVVVDNLATGLVENLPSGVQFVEGGAGDPLLLDRILPGCEVILHLAAVSSVQDSIDRPLAVHDTNVTATLSLLEAAVRHRVKRFIFSSSAAVYGDTGGMPAREDMKPNPLSHYAVQKLASEHYCGVYGRIYGLETICLRYFNVYGPRQRADSPYSGVIARFIEAARNNRPMVIFGSGEQTRDFVNVADVASANLAAATMNVEPAAGRILNVGSGRSISVNDLAEAVRAQFPAAPSPEHRESREGETRRSCSDISEAAHILGFKPTVSFGEGLGVLARA